MDLLAEKLEQSIEASTHHAEQLEAVMQEVRKPVIVQRQITLEFRSPKIIALVMGLFLAVLILGVALYHETRPDYDRMDNDLKYRYIKMKGEASPQRISELEDLFEINRDNAKILQMRKDVAEYERAMKEKALLDEQTRLRQMEAERLQEEAQKLKTESR